MATPPAAEPPPAAAQDAALPWAALAPARDAKGVKDALKASGWLDQGLKPGAAKAFGGRIAFPLLAGGAAAAKAACEAGEPAALRCVDAVERVTGLEPMKRAPPQGKKEQGAGTEMRAKRRPVKQPRSFGGGAGQTKGGSTLPPARAVRRVQCPPRADNAWLRAHVTDAREPVVLVGLDLGPCVGGWTPARLAAARCASAEVSVHVCPTQTVDLAGHREPNTPRNFAFKSLPFAEAVHRCANGEHAAALEPLLQNGERYYLRSVGVYPRVQPSDFPALFPDLAPECTLLPRASPTAAAAAASPEAPPEPEPEPEPDARQLLIDPSEYHSSVLRLASSDTQLWTHFDVMDNVLAQITGRKRVVLWSPEQDENLYVAGSSSRIENVDKWNDETFPLFRRAVPHRIECELAQGEALYIPALWFHNVTSIGFSVAVNVFWRGGAKPEPPSEDATAGSDKGSGGRTKKRKHTFILVTT